MEYFITSDIHSMYDELLSAICTEGFDINNPKHILVVVGDCFDRGPDAYQVFSMLVGLIKLNRCIIIKGNHEDYLLTIINNPQKYYPLYEDTYYSLYLIYSRLCEKITYFEYVSDFSIICDRILSNVEFNLFLDSLRDYYIIDDHLLVHASIPKKGIFQDDGWQEAREINPLIAYLRGDFNCCKCNIIVGHVAAGFLRYYLDTNSLDFYHYARRGVRSRYNNEISFYDRLIMIDGSVSASGKLNCYHISKL